MERKFFFIILILIVFSPGFLSAQWIMGVLHAFDGSDGSGSKGSLTLAGNILYGRTSAGGINNEGVIFKINTDSTGFGVLYYFSSGSSNKTGNQPHHDNMLQIGNTLYGTALMGGHHDNGVLYKISLDGTGYVPLRVFTGTSNDGGSPHSGVIAKGNLLYGITAEGGGHGNGTIYQIDTSGNNFSIIHNFHNSTGDNSHGRLTFNSDSTIVFGITRDGGTLDSGVIFSHSLQDSVQTVMHSFSGAPGDASYSDHGFLTLIGDTLYGMTQSGGAFGSGALFTINTDGSNYRLLHSFGANSSDGHYPFGSLAYSNGFLYGTTRRGGENDYGTTFRINSNGSIYQIIYSFDVATSGGYPIDNVVVNEEGNKLYGLTQVGGKNDPTGNSQYGTIFTLHTLGSNSIIKTSTEVPIDYKLDQNFPNPFNPVTKIKFHLPENSRISLDVFDVLGKRVLEIENTYLTSGSYEYVINAGNLSSGIYYYRLEATGIERNASITKKMMLVR